jgi:hypothetical protein
VCAEIARIPVTNEGLRRQFAMARVEGPALPFLTPAHQAWQHTAARQMSSAAITATGAVRPLDPPPTLAPGPTRPPQPNATHRS